MKNNNPQPPIFIHGILQRSGTNYLNKLILKDVDCEQPLSRVRENWFLHHSNFLTQYSETLLKIYSNPGWGGEDFKKEEILLSIGKSLIDFLQNQISSPNKKLVTKTPSVINLKNIDLLFPNIKNIIIVRNPLDVAASTYKSWKVPVNVTLDKWNEACLSIYEYEKEMHKNYLIIRYEDLIHDLRNTFTPCIEFLGLSPNAFDWKELENLPIYGSGDNEGKWEVNKKEKSFQAIDKWKNLPENQLELLKRSFNPDFAKYFGYRDFDDSSLLPILPELQRRLDVGKKFIKTQDDKIEKNKNSRIKDFKKGVKLVLKSISN